MLLAGTMCVPSSELEITLRIKPPSLEFNFWPAGWQSGGFWTPDPWITGPASKPGKSMHFEASAIRDQKPLRFAYKMEWNSEKIQKSSSETLGIHDVFASESLLAILL